MVTVETLEALDLLIWLGSGALAGEGARCDQSTVSRRVRQAQSSFGLKLQRRGAQWHLSGNSPQGMALVAGGVFGRRSASCPLLARPRGRSSTGARWSRPACHTAMATNPVKPACPIRLISFRLAAKGSTDARPLFLDGEGQICADPHWLPHEQAQMLARNQQLIWGSAARVQVL